MTVSTSVTIDGITVTISAEDIAFLTAETAISILLALSPLGIFTLPA